MATLNSTVYAAQISQPARLPDGGATGRSLQRAYVKHTFVGSNANNGDVINLVVLPPDAKVIPYLCRTSHQGAGTACPVILKDSAGTALTASTPAHTAGGANFVLDAGTEDLEVGLQPDGLLVAVIGTQTGVVINDVLQFEIVYTHTGAV